MDTRVSVWRAAVALIASASAAAVFASTAVAVDVSPSNRLTFEADCDIWVAGSDGSSPRRLTDTPERCEGSPAWSPDGSRIAYADWSRGITIINRDGSGRTVIPGTGEAFEPAWAPGGSTIAFTSPADPSQSDVYTIEIDGSALTQVTDSPMREHSPAYGPFGLTFARSGAFQGQHPAEIVLRNGTQVFVSEFLAAFTDLEWGPVPDSEGRRLLLAAGRGPFGTSQIFIVHYEPGVQGGQFYEVLFGGGFTRDCCASWRSDGQIYGGIVYEARRIGILLSDLPTMLVDTEALEAASNNTAPGTNVTVAPVDPATGGTPVTLTFSSVTESGRSAVSSAPTGPEPPDGFSVGSPPVYYEIQTSAGYEAPITVCISRAGITFDGEPRLFHFEDAWVDVTTSVTSEQVCGEVPWLSPFALFTPTSGDETPPVTAASASPEPNAAGWNRSDVTVSLNAVDEDGGSGVKEIRYTIGGVETVVTGSEATVPLTTEGVVTITYHAVDNAGNAETTKSVTVRIDKTAPALSCDASPESLWPPNHKLVDVATTVVSSDALSGGAGLELVSVTSNEPDNGVDDGNTTDDIQGWTIGTVDTTGMLRAERSGVGSGRTYTIRYAAADAAGNSSTCEAVVSVPVSRR